MPETIGLFCFDFSGSGKSEGDIVTYGAKEKEDIGTVFLLLNSRLCYQLFTN